MLVWTSSHNSCDVNSNPVKRIPQNCARNLLRCKTPWHKEKGTLFFISESSLRGDQRTEKYLLVLSTMDWVQCPDKGSLYACALLNDQESTLSSSFVEGILKIEFSNSGTLSTGSETSFEPKIPMKSFQCNQLSHHNHCLIWKTHAFFFLAWFMHKFILNWWSLLVNTPHVLSCSAFDV